MNYSSRDLKEIISVSAIQNGEYLDDIIHDVIYDSRSIGSTKGVLFLALQGEHRDGHAFIPSAYSKGVRIFLVESIPDGFEDATFLKVECVLDALSKWANHHRRQLYIPVIGVTGSNGKTVVKEWLAFLLQSDFKIHRSPRSYNSKLGVALSILGIRKEHNLAIIEAGISRPGEMAELWEMIKPSLAVLTHMGSAHDEGFSNRAAKASEKAILCKDADVVVFPKDQDVWSDALSDWKKQQPLTKWITWGEDERASYTILNQQPTDKGSTIEFKYRSMEHVLEIPFSDQASVANAMTCFSVLVALERWDEEHIHRFKQLYPLENRLSIHQGKRNNTIVNDSYSNDVESLIVALQVLKEQAGGKRKIAVLSPFLDQKCDLDQMKSMCLNHGVDELVWIGDSRLQPAYESVESFLSSERIDEIKDACILIKGGRSFGMESIVKALKRQSHSTFLEINLDHIRHNLEKYRSLLKKGVKTMVMVKASGYGSGQFQVSRMLENQGVDYFGVAFADEGQALRQAGVQAPIMVMNSDTDAYKIALDYALEPVVFSVSSLQNLIRTAEGKPIRCHIELNTGMNRLGFDDEDIHELISMIPPNIQIRGIFTHLASAEDQKKDEINHQQFRLFEDRSNQWISALGYKPMRHVLNSSGIVRFPEKQYDMVRLGIGLYGFDPSKNIEIGLKTTSALIASISQIRNVPAGESVGYGSNSFSKQDRTIATLNIGYADGLHRSFGYGNGVAFIRGQFVPFVGSICMDMCMVDITSLDVQEGDEVEIFGPNNSINEMADRGRTIPYEILTSISSRVNRVFVGEY